MPNKLLFSALFYHNRKCNDLHLHKMKKKSLILATPYNYDNTPTKLIKILTT